MGVKKDIRLFVDQEPVNDEFILGLSAGTVSGEDGRYHVAYAQRGAEETFSIGQPVYDSDNNLMGYLEIGVLDSLDYATNGKFNGESIPVEYWGIGKPTKYCEIGKQVFTYWQRWKTGDKDKRENNEILL